MDKKIKERFSENSLHSEFEAALTAILLGAVHRFHSAFKILSDKLRFKIMRKVENVLSVSYLCDSCAVEDASTVLSDQLAAKYCQPHFRNTNYTLLQKDCI
ncbi:hypothetical protein T01_14492 [Trichinella spiralis]|uniref:Uncharacterized protein n=1 Tax=Trichinella spiralis TaxID=6334 RepID=A0A0V1AS07_TRISP|nr:hypothetical protein T01_14492 [Trichinella spiralis]